VIVKDDGTKCLNLINDKKVIIRDKNKDEFFINDEELLKNRKYLNKRIEEVIINNKNSIENWKNNLKFIINNKEYENKASYYTMYTNREIEIRLKINDTLIAKSLKRLKWKMSGKDLNASCLSEKDTMIRFLVNEFNLPRYTNKLEVIDSLGKTLAILTIHTYHAPLIMFEENSEYNSEYFFDRGYEFTALANPTNYDTIDVGKNKKTYFAPVLGLNKGQSATIKVIINGFTDNVLNDKDFKIVFKPELTGKITINGLDSLVLDATGLDNLNYITIKAINTINQDILKAMFINVYVNSTREKVGMLKYYCAQKITKKVTLIYTKFKDENSFPSYLTPNEVSQFLNNNSLNQLFINLVVDSIHFISKKYNVNDMRSWTTTQIIDSLNTENFGNNIPTIYDAMHDYFYITNIVRPGSVPNSYLGGFHKIGIPGGVQVKYIVTSYNESAEELTAHELGHWLGLPHTFEKNTQVSVIIEPTQGGTKDNFMDYNVKRKKWLQIQLLNYIRN